MHEEVKAHMMGMLDVGAMCSSHSSWANMVVLDRKKDGKLRFCIVLRKLNEHAVNDSYNIPRILEALDCLNGAVWLTSLDLKVRLWQVKMEEESTPLTTFTLEPLGFYECDMMPFGLTNAPTTFQCLMETCLGGI